MKKQKIIRNLERAMKSTKELQKASLGKESYCGVEKFDDINLYVETWIVNFIEEALLELKK